MDTVEEHGIFPILVEVPRLERGWEDRRLSWPGR